MDAAVSQILLGVLTNLFSSTLERSVSDLAEIDIESALEEAGRELVAGTSVGSQLDRDRFTEFLQGPAVTTTLRMLFIATANAEPKSTAEIRAESQRAFVDTFGERRAADGKRLFLVFSRTMERILQAAAAEGSDEAGSALDSFRFRYLKEELAGLRASLDDLRRPSDVGPEEAAAWEALYRSQVQSRHGTIVPPSLDAADRVPIDEIYLPPTFRPQGAEPGGTSIESIDLTSSLSRAVVLGDPGAGKSTFAQKLAHDLARGSASVPGGSLVPFLVDLKEYGAEKERHRISITDWLESIAGSDYSALAPRGAIVNLLSSGRAAVIFDGLDVLLCRSGSRRAGPGPCRHRSRDERGHGRAGHLGSPRGRRRIHRRSGRAAVAVHGRPGLLECRQQGRLLIDTWAIGAWSATSPPEGDGPAMRAELIDD